MTSWVAKPGTKDVSTWIDFWKATHFLINSFLTPKKKYGPSITSGRTAANDEKRIVAACPVFGRAREAIYPPITRDVQTSAIINIVVCLVGEPYFLISVFK